MVSFSAVILAGGASKRFSEDKGLFLINDKPLSYFVINAVLPIISDIKLVVKNESQKSEYEKYLSSLHVEIISDNSKVYAPIVGLYAGLSKISSDYTLVLPVDSPLVSSEFVHFLISFAPTHGAVIPRWPSGYIEPLHAVYHTESARSIIADLIESNEYRVHKIIEELRNVLYVSTEVLRQIDSSLNSLININTPSDLSRIIKILKRKNL